VQKRGQRRGGVEKKEPTAGSRLKKRHGATPVGRDEKRGTEHYFMKNRSFCLLGKKIDGG